MNREIEIKLLQNLDSVVISSNDLSNINKILSDIGCNILDFKYMFDFGYIINITSFIPQVDFNFNYGTFSIPPGRLELTDIGKKRLMELTGKFREENIIPKVNIETMNINNNNTNVSGNSNIVKNNKSYIENKPKTYNFVFIVVGIIILISVIYTLIK